jgi:hypothetical protein
VLGLELKRHYNSQCRTRAWWARNWRISYETVLYDVGPHIQIVQADGRRLMFRRGRGTQATLCSSAQWADGQVRIERSGTGGDTAAYHWRWPDAARSTFAGGTAAATRCRPSPRPTASD